MVSNYQLENSPAKPLKKLDLHFHQIMMLLHFNAEIQFIEHIMSYLLMPYSQIMSLLSQWF